MPLSTPLMFTSIIAFQLVVSSAASGDEGIKPALRKITSTLPNVSLARATSAALSSDLTTSVTR